MPDRRIRNEIAVEFLTRGDPARISSMINSLRADSQQARAAVEELRKALTALETGQNVRVPVSSATAPGGRVYQNVRGMTPDEVQRAIYDLKDQIAQRQAQERNAATQRRNQAAASGAFGNGSFGSMFFHPPEDAGTPGATTRTTFGRFGTPAGTSTGMLGLGSGLYQMHYGLSSLGVPGANTMGTGQGAFFLFQGFRMLQTVLTPLGVAAAAAGVALVAMAAGTAKATESASKWIETMRRAADVTGMGIARTTANVNALSGILSRGGAVGSLSAIGQSQAGLSLGTMALQLSAERAASRMAPGAYYNPALSDPMAKFGISELQQGSTLQNPIFKEQKDLLYKIAETLSAIKDPARRSIFTEAIRSKYGDQTVGSAEMIAGEISNGRTRQQIEGGSGRRYAVTTQDVENQRQFARSWNDLKNTWDDIVSRIGAMMLPLFTGFFDGLKTGLVPLGKFVEFLKAVGEAFGSMRGDTMTFGKALGFLVGLLASAVGIVVVLAGAVFSILGAAFGAIIRLVGFVVSGFGNLLKVIAGLIPVVGVVAQPFKLLIGLFQSFQQAWKSLSWDGMLQAVKGWAIGVWDWLVAKAISAFSWMKDHVGDFFSGLGPALKAAWDGTSAAVGEVFSNIGTEFHRQWMQAADFVSGVPEKLGLFVLAVGTWKDQRAGEIGNIFSSLGTTMQDSLWSAADLGAKVTARLGDMLANIGEWKDQNLSGLSDAVNNIGSWLVEKFWGAVDFGKKVVARLGDMLANIGEWKDQKLSALADAVTPIGDWLKDKFWGAINFGQSLAARLGDMLSNIGEWKNQKMSAMQDAVEGVGNWLRDNFYNIIDFGKSLTDRLGDMVTNIGEWLASHVKEIEDAAGDIGGALMNGIKGGLQKAFDALPEWMRNAILGIVNSIAVTVSGGGGGSGGNRESAGVSTDAYGRDPTTGKIVDWGKYNAKVEEDKAARDHQGQGAGLVTNTGSGILAVAQNLIGATTWATNQCEKFIGDAFGGRRYPTAWADAQANARNFGSWRNGIPGNLIFFKPDSSNGMAGHVGVYAGGDDMISTIGGRVARQNISLPYWKNLYYGTGPVRFDMGGIAFSRPGGILGQVAEGGSDELMLPLNDRGAKFLQDAFDLPPGGATGGVSVVVNVDGTDFSDPRSVERIARVVGDRVVQNIRTVTSRGRVV